MPKKIKHIHKYQRDKLGLDYVIYRCVIPGCTHYISRNLVKGRLSLCHVCGEAMIMDGFALRRAKPRHRECIKKNEDFGKLQKVLDNII